MSILNRSEIREFVRLIMQRWDVEALKEEAKKLLKAFDWNPFKLNRPEEFENAWDEAKNNFVLIGKFIRKAVYFVEMVERDYEKNLSGAAKLEAAVDFLDDIIRLPLLLEWLDRPVLRLLLSLMVGQLNEKHGHEWPDSRDAEEICGSLI